MTSEEINLAWASDNTQLATPDQNWDIADAGSLIIRGTAPKTTVEHVLTSNELMPDSAPDVTKYELRDELDGPIAGFGKRFWEYLGKNASGILQQVLDGSDSIVKATYSDRYVRSPYVVNLLVNTLHELKACNGNSFQVEVLGRQYDRMDSREPWQCWHDWHSSSERDSAIKDALDYCGFDCTVSSQVELPHSRQLYLELQSGKTLTVQLDQGFSYWQTSRSAERYLLKFNFNSQNIGKEVSDRVRCDIESPLYDNTQIFVSLGG